MATTETGTGTEIQLGQRLTDNPTLRVFAVLVGIAASVALGVVVVLWTLEPNYSPLYGNLAHKDAVEIAQALQQAGIKYEIDQRNGIVMVPSSDLQDARMKLAGQGLPQTGSAGFELMQEDTGFSTSRLVESARYQRAIEGELARTIMTLTSVESARVHLANPKQSVFVRKRKFPSASVVLKLYSGRNLEKGQVEAITHLVASSVPELDVSKVTVVDHKGRLLSSKDDSREMGLTTSQFEYTRELESHYKQRIEDILSPMVGRENLRAEVTADVDFTYVEKTQEYFNPDTTALRSEQVNEQQSILSEAQGVPGALSNQPPAAATAPQTAGGAAEAGATPVNTTKRATRNYELDKTISHTRLPTSRLRRLSVAVVVNHRYRTTEDGAVETIERTAEEITRISTLVKEAIGYDLQRGDSVQVVDEAFYVPAPPEPLPQTPMWEEAWFWDIVRPVSGALLFLLLSFGVLKPVMTRLVKQVAIREMPQGAMAAAGGATGSLEGGVAGGHGGAAMGALADDDTSLHLPGPQSYEKTLDQARNMIEEDPKRVAQVVRKWIAEDARQ
jgi:flagellar M-ring protein FliF